MGCEEFMEIKSLKENGVDLEARSKGSSDLSMGMQRWSEALDVSLVHGVMG